MTRMLVYTLLLLSATLMVCQQQPQNPNPARTSAQAPPENGAQAQPSEQPLQDKAAANDHIQSNLQSVFDDDPILTDAEVETKVNDESITLSGTVQSYLQHQRVLQLVAPYHRYRKIVDKVTVQ
jgi:BON domain